MKGVSASQTGLPMNGANELSPPSVGIPDAGSFAAIRNPSRWFHHRDKEAEYWNGSTATREEAIDAGIADYDGEPFWIAEACRMVPSFAIFDGDDICERIGEDECWGEDGWEGGPTNEAKIELERRLTSVLRTWFSEHGDLDGAWLDEMKSEHIDAQAIEARRAATLGAVHESAVAASDAPHPHSE